MIAITVAVSVKDYDRRSVCITSSLFQTIASTS